jgi:predicted nucleotidyltransferase
MSPEYGDVMKPSEALAIHRARIRAIVAHYGGVNPRVFGSVARGEDTEDSDLDILVDDPEGHRLNLVALGGMNYDISSLIGRPVDVVPSADLPQRMRNEANSEAVPL